MKMYTKPSSVTVVPELSHVDFQLVDPDYRPYVFRGVVTAVGSDHKVLVNILGDSGALRSFILLSVCLAVFCFFSNTNARTFAKVQGMGLNEINGFFFYLCCSPVPLTVF